MNALKIMEFYTATFCDYVIRMGIYFIKYNRGVESFISANNFQYTWTW